MAEIEINIIDRQCTGGRIESKEKLESSVEIWSEDRNKNNCKIEWKFTKQDVDKKTIKALCSIIKLSIH